MPFMSPPYLGTLSADHLRSLVSLGYHPETRDKLCVPESDRRKAAYILGVQGSGKSRLLTHPSDYPGVRGFVETYLHPMQGHKRGAGRVEINQLRYDWVNARELEKPRVADPTWHLDSLLYDTMRSGNPWLPIAPEIVDGFSNCGAGFYKVAKRIGYGNPDLTMDVGYPKALVVRTADGALRWTRRPESGMEQFYHFIFHLRMVMHLLAEGPIGKATVVSTADVARMLTSLPKRAAFVHSADTVGVIYTHDTIPPLKGKMQYERILTVLDQTRKTYCRPKAEVEKSFMPATAQAQSFVQPVRAEEIE